jgi:hypothetical protein
MNAQLEGDNIPPDPIESGCMAMGRKAIPAVMEDE